jgi:sulfonate transport system substrate-binding protein
MSNKQTRLKLSLLTVTNPIIQHFTWVLSLLFILSCCLSVVLGSCTSEPINHSITKTQNIPSTITKTVRIGYLPFGTLLYLKAKGSLETRLAKIGWSVEWTEFPVGPPIFEAIGKEKLDMGYSGVAPPVFAQSAGVPFVYVANDSPLAGSAAIVVPQDSPIQTLADLKGKKIAVTQKSAGHYLLIRALVKGGLKLEDIELIDLFPLQAKEVFMQRKVDAWVIWQPFIAQLQESMPVRFLTNSDGLMNDRNFYFASRSFASEFADIVKIVMEEARQVGNSVTNNPILGAQMISASTGMKLTTALIVTKSRRYDALPIQDRAVEEQQRIAEIFFRLGLLPDRIWIEDAIWKQKLD